MKKVLLSVFVLFFSLGLYAQDIDKRFVQQIPIEQVKIYPNPTESNFSLLNDEEVGFFTIYNIIGKEVRSYKHQNLKTYDISDLKQGIYIVRFFDENNDVLKVLRLNRK